MNIWDKILEKGVGSNERCEIVLTYHTLSGDRSKVFHTFKEADLFVRKIKRVATQIRMRRVLCS